MRFLAESPRRQALPFLSIFQLKMGTGSREAEMGQGEGQKEEGKGGGKGRGRGGERTSDVKPFSCAHPGHN